MRMFSYLGLNYKWLLLKGALNMKIFWFDGLHLSKRDETEFPRAIKSHLSNTRVYRKKSIEKPSFVPPVSGFLSSDSVQNVICQCNNVVSLNPPLVCLLGSISVERFFS